MNDGSIFAELKLVHRVLNGRPWPARRKAVVRIFPCRRYVVLPNFVFLFVSRFVGFVRWNVLWHYVQKRQETTCNVPPTPRPTTHSSPLCCIPRTDTLH